MPEQNHFGQTVGEALPQWEGTQPLPRITLAGLYCRLQPLDAQLHSGDLLHAFAQAPDDRDWTWLAGERPTTLKGMAQWVMGKMVDQTVHPFAVIDASSGRAVGVVAWLAIDAQNGSVEIGHVTWSPLMQKSALGTEAIGLMLHHAFACGYRRVEWKCDALNVASRRAAERIGFTWEGRFRQHMVRKGRNRDSDYLSMLDNEWPLRSAALSAWLATSNFDVHGKQLRSLDSFHEQW